MRKPLRWLPETRERYFRARPTRAIDSDLINSFLSRGIAALVAEAVTTATKAGVDLATMFEVISAGGANSSVFQRFMPWVLSGDSGMEFKLKNGQKDVRY
jgi:3-hydroxyisobutyrate dehydrogenase-like beta-hydroxyacid dehydrogenase